MNLILDTALCTGSLYTVAGLNCTVYVVDFVTIDSTTCPHANLLGEQLLGQQVVLPLQPQAVRQQLLVLPGEPGQQCTMTIYYNLYLAYSKD